MMLEDILSLLFWMTCVSLGAMLWAQYESEKVQKETDERIAEINRELRRRTAPAE
ncbi:hypothetical protein DEV91_110175 [Phyllobacterium brassicacearum]|nr:hypothetical protein DEV91_110175 [Phyllobacterium brassicacearum]